MFCSVRAALFLLGNKVSLSRKVEVPLSGQSSSGGAARSESLAQGPEGTVRYVLSVVALVSATRKEEDWKNHSSMLLTGSPAFKDGPQVSGEARCGSCDAYAPSPGPPVTAAAATGAAWWVARGLVGGCKRGVARGLQGVPSGL